MLLRLRPLVEVLDPPRGDLYLLQGPGDADFVIRQPNDQVRAIVRALRQGGSVARITAACAQEGVETSARTVSNVAGALDAAGMLEPTTGEHVLEAADAERLDRQLLYLRQRAEQPETGLALQARLRAARVVIIGCGGIGSWAAWNLATLGVGELILVDPDRVDPTNLNRQMLFDADDVGEAKVEIAERRLRAFDPRLTVRAVRESVAGPGDVLALAHGVDLVVACADTPPYEIGRWINDGCAAAGVPHISAGQMPPIIRVGPFVKPGETACVHCLESANRRDNPLAGELETKRRSAPSAAATLGPLCSLIGGIIGAEALHWLTGLGRPATWGTAVTIDIRTFAVDRVRIAAACDACQQAHVSP